jgi:hypothetical protein
MKSYHDSFHLESVQFSSDPCENEFLFILSDIVTKKRILSKIVF